MTFECGTCDSFVENLTDTRAKPKFVYCPTGCGSMDQTTKKPTGERLRVVCRWEGCNREFIFYGVKKNPEQMVCPVCKKEGKKVPSKT